MNHRFLAATALAVSLAGVSRADDPAPSPPAVQRYTFSWPSSDTAPVPRGGTTRGAPVFIDATPSAAWRALKEARLPAAERDRRAILALAGDYRVTFDFLEIADFNGKARDRPYQSWGTERVYVDREEASSVSLVHILEMHIIQPDGSVGEPLVTKHWREDWRYQPDQLVEFKGNDHWQRRAVGRQEGAGSWSQTVTQVDESPRYASLGRWEHNAVFSSWVSGSTWRPLPRRESEHKDYQVLLGTNRVSVTATGSVQEENNLKMVLGAGGHPDPANPYLAREYGVARYERLRDGDFAAADLYYERTRQFWAQVHDAWAALYRDRAAIALDGAASMGVALRLSNYADQLADGHSPDLPAAQVIRDALQAAAPGVTPAAKSGTAGTDAR